MISQDQMEELLNLHAEGLTEHNVVLRSLIYALIVERPEVKNNLLAALSAFRDNIAVPAVKLAAEREIEIVASMSTR